MRHKWLAPLGIVLAKTLAHQPAIDAHNNVWPFKEYGLYQEERANYGARGERTEITPFYPDGNCQDVRSGEVVPATLFENIVQRFHLNIDWVEVGTMYCRTVGHVPAQREWITAGRYAPLCALNDLCYKLVVLKDGPPNGSHGFKVVRSSDQGSTVTYTGQADVHAFNWTGVADATDYGPLNGYFGYEREASASVLTPIARWHDMEVLQDPANGWEPTNYNPAGLDRCHSDFPEDAGVRVEPPQVGVAGDDMRMQYGFSLTNSCSE